MARERGFFASANAALVLLTALNFLNYVDRYVLAAVQEQVKADPAFAGITDAALGALQTPFFYSYMLLSPIAGIAARRVPRRYLIAIGVGLWSLVTVASGLARSYHELFLARALVGCGEAGYATVAPAMLSDLFSRDSRNKVLSIFYLATPVGSALGFVIGGEMAALSGWRSAFFVAGGPGLLLALAALLLPDPPRGAQDRAFEGTGETPSLAVSLRSLARNRDFLQITAGTTLMVFAIGALAVWMPTYLQVARGRDVASANQAFGGIAVVAGIVGTFGGSRLGDLWVKTDPRAFTKLSAIGLLLAAPFAFAVPFVPSLWLCYACAFLAELGIFLNTGPLNTAFVNSVPASIREAAIGLNVLCIHLFGDALSPFLFGALTDALVARGHPRSAALGIAISAISVPLFLAGLVLLARRPTTTSTAPGSAPAQPA